MSEGHLVEIVEVPIWPKSYHLDPKRFVRVGEWGRVIDTDFKSQCVAVRLYESDVRMWFARHQLRIVAKR